MDTLFDKPTYQVYHIKSAGKVYKIGDPSKNLDQVRNLKKIMELSNLEGKIIILDQEGKEVK